MITMSLDWREVLWWLQGGMAGSHLRWSVYEDMVNRVWPQCTEQERRNIFLIMRRDLGTCWRPDGWPGHALMREKGEGAWKADDKGMAIDHNDPDGKPCQAIHDLQPWMFFRQVLACFDPDNQYQVNLQVRNNEELECALAQLQQSRIVGRPSLCHFPKDADWQSDTATLSVRTYFWDGEYRIGWDRYCDKGRITSIEKMELPDDGTW